MPAGDGTGPVGYGPRTGRGVGYCVGYDAPGWANLGPGRRFYGRGGRWGGYGGGWRWRNWYHATGLPRWARWSAPYTPPSREQEIDMLKDEAEWLKDQLDAIDRRMDDLSQE